MNAGRGGRDIKRGMSARRETRFFKMKKRAEVDKRDEDGGERLVQRRQVEVVAVAAESSCASVRVNGQTPNRRRGGNGEERGMNSSLFIPLLVASVCL